MPKRVDILMRESRRNANVNAARWSSLDLTKIFNDAQDYIRQKIHTANGTGKFFPKVAKYPMNPGQQTYSLPPDCYAFNSIISVELESSAYYGRDNTKLRQLAIGERTVSDGYYAYGRELHLSFEPAVGGSLIVFYNTKLATLSPRIAEVNIVEGKKIRAKRDTFLKEDITAYGDYISIVDRRGMAVECGLELDEYRTETGTITLYNDVPETVSRGHFVALGEMASTHTFLPEESYRFLTTWVERRTEGAGYDPKVGFTSLITKEEEESIEELFSQNENDVRHTPLNANNYLTL